MKALVLDKIASVTLNCALRKDVRVSADFPCQEGDVVAVRILNVKSTYNTLELPSGRMSSLKPGDIIAGALGHRNALQGFSGSIPKSLQIGDRVNLLNMGGVIGICTSYSPVVGEPFECEVLGQVLSFPDIASRKGVPANIGTATPQLSEKLLPLKAPVIAVAGTCMNSGKTEACLAIIKHLTRRGMRVVAAKATGVSLRRDILAMEDAGAIRTTLFTDLGIVTTQASNSAALTITMLNQLSSANPDVYVVELGDGLMGSYGVDSILADREITSALTSLVLAANDPVGAWGAHKILTEKYGIDPSVITGPATDNLAGTHAIQESINVPAYNARTNANELTNCALKAVIHA